MKRLLLFCFILFPSSFTWAQCVPDVAITEPGIYPNPLPTAKAGTSYSETIQFKFPKDTVISGNKVPIDSVEITSIDNFPAGFTYQCNKSNCTYLGNENGCIQINGQPNNSQVGDYTLEVKGTAYFTFGATVIPQPFAEPMDFKVVSDSSSSILTPERKTIELNCFPNPFNEVTHFTVSSSCAQVSLFKVYNITGKEVFSNQIRINAGKNTFEFNRDDLLPGLYLYSLYLENKSLTGRMQITD